MNKLSFSVMALFSITVLMGVSLARVIMMEKKQNKADVHLTVTFPALNEETESTHIQPVLFTQKPDVTLDSGTKEAVVQLTPPTEDSKKNKKDKVSEKPEPKKDKIKEIIYEVRPKDTYGHISHYFFGTTRYAKDIEEANGIPAKKLRPGKKIRIPIKDPAHSRKKVIIIKDNVQKTFLYTIKSGDTVSEIAEKFLKSVDKGKRADKIRDVNPGIKKDKIKVGEVIHIPVNQNSSN